MNTSLSKESSTFNVPIVFIVLFVWFIVAMSWISQTQKGGLPYEHDLAHHLDYTKIIVDEHRLPTPYERYITYHPPLFYLIAQFFQPLNYGHIYKVRTISVLTGAVILLCILYLLSKLKIPPLIQGLITVYLAVTPAFVVLFTSYNNDGLAMTFSAMLLVASYAYLQSNNKWWLVVAFLSISLGIYSKYSAIYPALVVLAVLAGLFLWHRSLRQPTVYAALAIIVGLSTLLPFTILHNKHYTGKFFPHNAEHISKDDVFSIYQYGGPASFTFGLPTHVGEWTTPYSLDTTKGYFRWSKATLTSSIISTSLFDEWEFSAIESPLLQFLGWSNVWIRLLIILLVLILFKKKMILPGLVLLLGLITHAVHVAFIHQVVNAANFRYYAWVMLPLAVLIGLTFESLRSRKIVAFQAFFIALLAAGLLSQLWFILLAIHSL